MSENGWGDHTGAPVTPDCGSPGDGQGLWLWLQVQHWAPLKAGPCNPCIEVDTTNKWVLWNDGTSGGVQIYLLIPTDRKKGIECPAIWEHPNPNYWVGALTYAARHMSPSSIGLGINSKYARKEDQLHIHLAPFEPEAKKYLDANFGKVAQKPVDWPNSILRVPGRKDTQTPPQPQVRSYRVLFVKSLAADNLFHLLRDMLPAADQMGNQTMTVIPTTAPQPLGFYVLNSETTLDLNRGTSTCDLLLACN
ncbi:CDP-diacylglycerol diphosphatase [Streptomyces luteogriseus]|uniref:CDP-diacylglycerol diphosphatase n=1 Tax=Streptomyces luteogriseus TaxID=68233 RepID=A0A7W7GGM7_9ACTN|nr:CDP-diacylglycerol diphosphatase [Streptomyces luteogriseus]MBB4714497.1 CDP-diacylglycerol pyrophosphatase [Streptomyces luteogriseus]